MNKQQNGHYIIWTLLWVGPVLLLYLGATIRRLIRRRSERDIWVVIILLLLLVFIINAVWPR